MILLVFVIQCLVYKEVTALFDLSFSKSRRPTTRHPVVLTSSRTAFVS